MASLQSYQKKRFLNWWRIEGKIECSAGILALVVLIVFWDSLLVQGIIAIIGSLWALGKIYFRRDQKLLLLLLSGLVFFQGLSYLLAYFRTR